VRALCDLLVALRGTIAIASRRSSRARVAAVGLVASLALGGHLAVSRMGDDAGPGVASPPGQADAAGREDGPAGGGPLNASLTATGDHATRATDGDAAGGSGAGGPEAGPPRSTAAVADGPVDDDGGAGAPGEAASTTTAPAASTTSLPTSAPSAPGATTTVPDGGSPNLIGGLLDLLGL
jgi:hypothetical protein